MGSERESKRVRATTATERHWGEGQREPPIQCLSQTTQAVWFVLHGWPLGMARHFSRLYSIVGLRAVAMCDVCERDAW